MPFRKNHSRAGFSLIEVLLYVLLSGFLMVAITELYIVTSKTRVKNQTVLEVEQQGAFVLSFIKSKLQDSSAVLEPITGQTSDILNLSNLLPENDPTVFQLEEGVLIFSEGGDLAIDLTSSRVTLSNLQFQNLTASSVADILQVKFRLDSSRADKGSEYTFGQDFVTSIRVLR